jgi:hypothetical protein
VLGPSYLTLVRPCALLRLLSFRRTNESLLLPFVVFSTPPELDSKTFYPTTTTYETSRTTIPTTTKTKTSTPGGGAYGSTSTAKAKYSYCADGDANEKEHTGLVPTHDQSITLYVIAICAYFPRPSTFSPRFHVLTFPSAAEFVGPDQDRSPTSALTLTRCSIVGIAIAWNLFLLRDVRSSSSPSFFRRPLLTLYSSS